MEKSNLYAFISLFYNNSGYYIGLIEAINSNISFSNCLISFLGNDNVTLFQNSKQITEI